MQSAQSRHSLLRRAFVDVPASIQGIALRPLSAGSFELLGEINSPLVFGNESSQKLDLQTLVSAAHEYIWIHSADLEKVLAIRTRDDLPRDEIRRLAMSIPLGEVLAFTTQFTESALRMAASMAEPEDEEDEPGKPETRLTGSHRSSLPAELPGIPSESAGSFGTLPSSELTNTSTPQTSPQEPDANGPTPLMILPLPAAESTPPG